MPELIGLACGAITGVFLAFVINAIINFVNELK